MNSTALSLSIRTLVTVSTLAVVCALTWGQAPGRQAAPPASATQQTPQLTKEQLADIQKLLDARDKKVVDTVHDAELQGIKVRLGDIGRFRGSRTNVLQGVGLVVGLEGTGDTRSTPWTTTLVTNYMSRWGTVVDEKQVRSKNIAAVMITAEMPAFVAPGTKLDITISSSGDAKSLEGGVLLPTTLTSMSDAETAVCTAYGSVSIGGFNASSGGGNSVRKNHTTTGIISGGATVEKSVSTQFVFDGNVMYYDLDDPDFTTAERSAQALREAYPNWLSQAQDGATIKIVLPAGYSPMQAAEQIEHIEVYANTPATVVVNERTGTIVVGGNVRLGPAVIAHGSLQVTISTDVQVSQPEPFSKGETVVVATPHVDATETPAQIGLLTPNATLDDLAKILQTLKVSARDMIAILQALQAQGALKARIKQQ